MKRFFCKFLLVSFLFVLFPVFFVSEKKLNGASQLSSLFWVKPQGLGASIFSDPYIYGCNECFCENLRCCNLVNLGYRFTHSTRPDQIAKSLFSSDKLIFQGSLLEEREEGSLIADYFGLSPAYSGILKLKPEIAQHHIDFSVRIPLDCLGLSWFGFSTSLVHANWNLGAKTSWETLDNKLFRVGILDTFPLYMSEKGNKFASSLKEVLGGDFVFGDMKEPWKYGRMDLGKNGISDTKFADLNFLLGYDFYVCDDSHVSIFAKAVVPTGTKLDQRYVKYVFNPMIGNGHYWELGAGVDVHYDLFACDNRCLSVHLNGHITHMFKNTQWRTFDFENYGPLSRYMLLKELEKINGLSDPKVYDYAGRLINGVNYTTRQFLSSFDVQGEGSVRLIYKDCGWAIGLGYNIYGRSEEKIEDMNISNPIDSRLFGMKGNTGVYYKNNVGQAFKLNATQTNFENLSITNLPKDETSGFFASNQGIDNGVLVGNPFEFTTWDNLDPVESQSAVLIKQRCGDVVNFALYKRQLIHKVFVHVDYQWEDCCYCPYFGLYGEYDFASKKDYQSLNLWGIGVHCGISF